MMGSLGSPKTWIPYMNTKDCSQGFCSLYCPQWCYILIPPPPAHAFEFPQDNSSSPNFSPLVVAVIGILVSAFLLVSYYTVISKYCGNEDRRGRRDDHDLNMELGDTHQNPSSIHEAWHVTTPGLDEALIKSLTVCKYKKGDGFVDGTDCAVCLSEFEEDESLRLLPKCNHAFHLPCIDTWLTSHSNCPLCRANIVSPHHVVTENPPLANHDATLAESQGANDQNLAMEQDSERGSSQNFELHAHGDHVIPKRSSMRGLSDFRNSEQRESTIIQIGGDPEEYHHQRIRRSVSMDHSPPNQVLVADILSINEEEEEEEDDDDDYQEDKNIHDHGGGCSDSESAGGVGKSSHRNGLLHCVKSPVAMKRSFSSGRICLSRPSRARHTVIPV